ncbi:MAG: mechanosensitive ion channel [Clostridiaceae bacterium]|nr:mechanosensitive ion channel [Clostridiaceae bacterium]
MINLFAIVLPIIKSIVFAIVVLVVGLLIIKWLTKIVEEIIDKKGLDATLKPFIKSIVSAVLKAMLIVAVIGILGIETTSFVAIFGAAGLAVGLAFQGSLSNFAGGVLILVTKPFKVGDYIESNGYSGTVEAVRILYTDLVTVDNKVIRIPNGNLSNASLVNYSEKDTRRVDFQFSAAYEADYNKVIRVLKEIVTSHPKTLKEPEPFVRMSEHGDSAIVYTVRVWANSADYWTVHFDVIEKVKQRFDEEGLSIPYPQMDVHVKE